jgi:hypothetical protein
MRAITSVCLLLACLCAAGCVSKAKAKADARKAYLAGRQEVVRNMQRVGGATVTVIGQVVNPVVKWEEGMTLGGAILAAEYTAPQDPQTITIIRNNQPIPVDPRRLLRGEDLPVEVGDVIEIRP